MVESGDARHDYTLRNGRAKWSGVTGLLEALPWVAIHAMDGRNNLLGVINMSDEQLEDDEGPSISGELAMMLKAQEVALKHQGQHTERLLKCAVEMVEAAAERTASLERTVARLSDDLHTITHKQAEAAGENELEGMIETILKAKFGVGMQ